MPEHQPEPPAFVRPPRVRRRTKRSQRSTSRPTPPPSTTDVPSTTTPDPDGEHRDADPSAWEVADLIAAGVLDVVPGDPPVPVSIWRATGPQEPSPSPATLYRGLTPTLAARLLAIYTDPGQTVLDTTSDPAVAGAAGASARRYLDLALPQAHLMSDLGGQVALILLRWPPTATPQDGGREGSDPQPELTACAGLLSAEGHTVVILAPPTGGTYRDHARTLIPAASHAGLGYLQHLVVITLPVKQPPSRSEDDPTITESGYSATQTPHSRSQAHLDLLVFILRHGTRP